VTDIYIEVLDGAIEKKKPKKSQLLKQKKSN
jgi:hypothetical protein